jgi:hypothetical protein
LPIGLSSDCKLLRDIPKDTAISYHDLELPAGRLSDQIRAEQDAYFFSASGQSPSAATKSTTTPRDGLRQFESVRP